MEKTSSSRVAMFAGIGIAFVAGSVISGGILKGSLSQDARPCLMGALDTYIAKQNSLIQKHAGAIQTIVQDLQSAIQTNNGKTMTTDFARMSDLLDKEDRSYAEKISTVSEKYRVTQARCQPTSASNISIVYSSVNPEKSPSSPSRVDTYRSSTESLKPAANATPSRYSAGYDPQDNGPSDDDPGYPDGSNGPSDDNDVLESGDRNTSGTRGIPLQEDYRRTISSEQSWQMSEQSAKSTATKKGESVQSSFASSQSAEAPVSAFRVNFITEIPSIRGNGQYAIIAQVSTPKPSELNALYLVPEGPIPNSSNLTAFGKFTTKNNLLVNLTTKTDTTWQIINASLDSYTKDISRTDQEKSIALYKKNNEEVLENGFRESDYAKIQREISRGSLADFAHSENESVIHAIANAANVPHLQSLVRQNKGGVVTVSGRISNPDTRVMNNVVFIGSDVISHAYSKKLYTSDGVQTVPSGGVKVKNARVYPDGTFDAEMYGRGDNGIWMVDASIDGDASTVSEGDVYGSLLLNRGMNILALTSAQKK